MTLNDFSRCCTRMPWPMVSKATFASERVRGVICVSLSDNDGKFLELFIALPVTVNLSFLECLFLLLTVFFKFFYCSETFKKTIAELEKTCETLTLENRSISLEVEKLSTLEAEKGRVSYSSSLFFKAFVMD